MSGRRWQEHDLQTLDKGLDRPDRDDDQYHHIDDQHRAIGDCNEPFMHDGLLGTSSNTSSDPQPSIGCRKQVGSDWLGEESHALPRMVSRPPSSTMPAAKRSVSTGPRMDVASINTSTALSIVSSSIRCPAPLRVSKATTAAARVAATCGKVSAHIVDLAAGV